MDPNMTLEAIRAIVDRMQRHGFEGVSRYDTMELCELVEALDKWLASGGFLLIKWGGE